MRGLSPRIIAFFMIFSAASSAHALTILHQAQVTLPISGTLVVGNCISTISGNTGPDPVTTIIIDCELKKATVLQSFVLSSDNVANQSATYDIQVSAPIVFNCMWCTHNENIFTQANGNVPGNQAANGPKSCKFSVPPGPPGGGGHIP